MTLSIDTIHAYIAVDDEGEGITGFAGPDGRWMPMLAADEDRIKSLRPMAQELATLTGKRIVLAKFSVREDMEYIEPGDLFKEEEP